VVMALILQFAQMRPRYLHLLWDLVPSENLHPTLQVSLSWEQSQRLTASEGAWKTARLPVWWCPIGWMQTSRLN